MNDLIFKGKFMVSRLLILIPSLLLFILTLAIFIDKPSINTIFWVILFFLITYIIFYNTLAKDIIVGYKYINFLNPYGRISTNLKTNNIISAKIKHYSSSRNPFSIVLTPIIVNILSSTVSSDYRVLVLTDNEMNEYKIYDFSYNGFNRLIKELYKLNKESFYNEVEEYNYSNM